MCDQRERKRKGKTQTYLKKTFSGFFFNTYLQNGPFDSWTSLMYIISDWRSFLYDFWQFNKSSWQIKWLCWQVNCTANQYFQLLSLSFRKNTTWGHTVVKPRKENKTRSNWRDRSEREGSNKLKYHPILWAGGTPEFLRHVWKMALPLGWLCLYNGDFFLPRSYLKVIRFEPWTHNILLKGPPFRHLLSHHQHIPSSLDRTSRTTSNVSQPFQGSIGQSKKFKSENAKAEVSLLKLFKGVAANQYFQMCIYHMRREVTYGERNKHTEIFQFFHCLESINRERWSGVQDKFEDFFFLNGHSWWRILKGNIQ